MKNTLSPMNELLAVSLHPSNLPEGPDGLLSEDVKICMKKAAGTRKPHARPFRVAIICLALITTVSIGAYALNRLLTSPEVATEFGSPILAEAFKSKDATIINQSVVSNEFNITLLGIVSGKNIPRDVWNQKLDLSHADRSYIVVAITKTDGSSMEEPLDPDLFGTDAYFNSAFILSPYPKGVNPFLAYHLTAEPNYGYGSGIGQVINGVYYIIFECDSLEVFADRGVYLLVWSHPTSYELDLLGKELLTYDSSTGEIGLNPYARNARALFDLPLDPRKADPDEVARRMERISDWANDSENVARREKFWQEAKTPEYWAKKDTSFWDDRE